MNDDEHDDDDSIIGQSPQKPFLYTGQERTQVNPRVKYATIASDVKEFEGAAFHQTDVIHVDYTSNEASSLTSIGRGVFYECSFLTHVQFPPFIEAVRAHAFRDCIALQQVDFSLCQKLESIDSLAFDGCRSIESIDLPAALKQLTNGAFAHCKALQMVDFSKATGLQTIGRGAFVECIHLNTIQWSSGIVTIDKRAFFKCPALTHLDFASMAPSLQTIGWEAFKGCTALESVIYPPSLRTIQEFAFYDCSQLQSINFETCEKLNAVKSSAYGQCLSLKHVLLVSEAVMEGARQATPVSFWSQAPPVYVWDLLLSYKTVAQSPKEPFLYTGQSEAAMPKNVHSVIVDAKTTQILDKAFQHCTQLQDVDFSNATSLEKIGMEAFDECHHLETCEFPANLKFIAQNAFGGCESLSSIQFASPNQLQAIEGGAFVETAITNVSIPYSVTSLNRPFDPSKLTRIDIMGNNTNQTLALSLRLSLYYPDAFVPSMTMDRCLYLYSYHRVEGFSSGLLNWPMADGEMERFQEIQRHYPDALFRLVRFCAETQVISS